MNWRHVLRWCLGLCLCVLAACNASASHQHEPGPLLSTAYWVDKSGQATLQDAGNVSDWRDFQGVLALGFLPHPVWVKLEINRSAQGLPWFWRLLPSYLDDVRLYIQDGKGEWSEHRSGDKIPFHDRETADVALAFPWQAPAAMPEHVTAYIRLQSSSTMVANIQLLTPEAWHEARDRQGLLSGIMLGLMGLVVVWAFYQVYATRDALFVHYAVYVVFCFIMALGLFGYSAEYLFPESQAVDFLTSLSVILASTSGWAFHRKFLQPFIANSKVRWMLDPALVISVGTLVLVLSGYRQWALALTNYTIVAYGSVLLPAMLMMLWPRLDLPNRRLIAYYLIFPVGIVITLLPNLGWMSAGVLTGYGGIAHSLLVAMILATMLSMRQKNVEQSVIQFRAEAAAAHAQADMIRKDRDEKDRFFAMLSHELRTPLSVIKMVLDNQQAQHGRHDALVYAQRAVDDIDNVIALAMQVDRLEQGMIELQFAPCFLPEIVRGIRDSHEKGERVVLKADPATPGVRSDPVLLKVILSNLLDNALKYSPLNSEVLVDLRPAGHGDVPGVEVTVSNPLYPSDRPDPDQMCSKYYRSKSAHRVSGSGLGLYVVDGLVRLLKGSLRVELDHENLEISLHVWIPA